MSATQADEMSGVPAILRRVVANAGLLLGGRAVNAILGLGALALAARALGAAELGVLVLIQAFAQFLGEVVKFQSWQTLLHYGARPLAEGRTADFQKVLRFTALLDLASTVLGIALGVAGCLLFADVLGWSRAQAPAAALFMLSIAFMVSATPTGLLRLFDRFDVMARQSALTSLIRLLTCAIAFVAWPTMEAFLAAWAIGTIGSWFYIAVASWRELKRRNLTRGFAWRGPIAGGLPGVWGFAWNTNLTATLDVAFTHASTLIVGALVGPAPAAFWRVGRQVADAIAKPAKLLTPALYPELARLYADERQNAMWRLASRVGLIAGGIGVLLLAITAFAGPQLLTLVMGDAFAPAALVMTWQVAAAVIGIFALPLEPMLISLGKPGAAVVVRVAISAVFLAALPFLVDHFGLIGAGAGLAVATAALAVGMLWFILREDGIRRGGDPTARDADENLKG